MSSLGAFHLGFAVASLVLGLAVVLSPKGTRRHRLTGRAYAVSMLALNVTALFIYRLFGHFGPFHIAAVVSLASLTAGVLAVWLHRPRKAWHRVHAESMSWSYVGLVAAACAEVGSRYLRGNFALVVIACSAVVLGIGGYLVHTRVPRALRRRGLSA